MTAIRPILLSMSFHGLLLIVLALVPLAKATQEQHQEIMVELTEPAPPIEQVRTEPLPSVPPPVVQKAVHYKPSRQLRQRRAVRHVSMNHVVLPTKVRAESSKRLEPRPVPTASSILPSASGTITPVPEFKEMPRRVEATSSTTRFSDQAPGAGLDFGVHVTSMSDAAGISPVSRPLLASASATGRLLRDPTAELINGAPSKVRLGDNLRPEYPRLAREAGWEGTVMLRIEVLADGKAGVISVHRSSGHQLLDEAALTAVQKWRFVPAMDGNFPIRSIVQLPIRFDLKTQY